MDPIREALELAAQLPPRAVIGIFERYGKPLEEPLEPDEDFVAVGTAQLRAIEVRTPVDVVANHWFVLDGAGSEALAVPGPLFAAALAALAQSLRR